MFVEKAGKLVWVGGSPQGPKSVERDLGTGQPRFQNQSGIGGITNLRASLPPRIGVRRGIVQVPRVVEPGEYPIQGAWNKAGAAQVSLILEGFTEPGRDETLEARVRFTDPAGKTVEQDWSLRPWGDDNSWVVGQAGEHNAGYGALLRLNEAGTPAELRVWSWADTGMHFNSKPVLTLL